MMVDWRLKIFGRILVAPFADEPFFNAYKETDFSVHSVSSVVKKTIYGRLSPGA
jgi:hypothetical protein